MSELYHVSASPHVRSKVSTDKIMLCVVISLLPATVFGIYNFGVSALILTLLSIASCVLSEFLYTKLMHQKTTVKDYSAVVTGLLLALNLPATVSWWIPVLGGVFAILVCKMVFGGLGRNIMNPALGARCFLLISFTGQMTSFSSEKYAAIDAYSGATPLAYIKNGGTEYDLMSMFTGRTLGTIGETSAIALLIGAAFLLAMGVISIQIPAAYLLSFVLFLILFSGHGLDLPYLAAEVCGGGLLLGAFFMATDYVTSPITPRGRLVFGIILGLLTGIFRIYGGSAEGVSYAIIFTNLLVPLIERFTIPAAFGKSSEKKKKKGDA